jgi:Bifunctional DNA primase/polymerase, N-terminal
MTSRGEGWGGSGTSPTRARARGGNAGTLPNPPQRRAAATRGKVWPLLELGLYPIPVNPRTRRPLVAWGELDRLGYRPGVGEALVGTLGDGPPDRWVPLVFEWWDRWPAAGAAVLTGLSRLLVVDVDPRHGGHHTLRRLVAATPLPATRTVRTRHGGIHLYYRVDRLVRGRAGALGPGLDVKSRRGLVVSPPTPGYTLEERRPVTPAPGWLLQRCGATGSGRVHGPPRTTLEDPAARATLDEAVAAILQAPPGRRHDVVVHQAARVFSVTDDDQAEAELVQAAARRARSGRDRWDGERAVRDARAWARQRRPRRPTR